MIDSLPLQILQYKLSSVLDCGDHGDDLAVDHTISSLTSGETSKRQCHKRMMIQLQDVDAIDSYQLPPTDQLDISRGAIIPRFSMSSMFSTTIFPSVAFPSVAFCRDTIDNMELLSSWHEALYLSSSAPPADSSCLSLLSMARRPNIVLKVLFKLQCQPRSRISYQYHFQGSCFLATFSAFDM